MRTYHQFYINGQWVEPISGGTPCNVVNPATEEVIAMANDTVYGLSGYVWGGPLERAAQVAKRLRTGIDHLNGANIDLAAQFGGAKQSGGGREWGACGIDEFVKTKAIMGAVQPQNG